MVVSDSGLPHVNNKLKMAVLVDDSIEPQVYDLAEFEDGIRFGRLNPAQLRNFLHARIDGSFRSAQRCLYIGWNSAFLRFMESAMEPLVSRQWEIHRFRIEPLTRSGEYQAYRNFYRLVLEMLFENYHGLSHMIERGQLRVDTIDQILPLRSRQTLEHALQTTELATLELCWPHPVFTSPPDCPPLSIVTPIG